MQYQTFAPPEALISFIKYFWALQSESTGSGKTFNAIPDGSPGVIMVRSDKEAFCLNHNKKLPDIFLYGQTLAPASFSSSGRLSIIGICFQPHALKSIFGLDAHELTGAGVDLTLLKDTKDRIVLPEQLAEAATIEEQIRILSRYLLARIRGNNHHPDAITEHAIARITAAKGRVSLKELHHQLQLSERTFERRFKQTVGIPPKLFSRIIRFQESVTQLRKSDYKKLSDIAYDNDYADQSHFIRVFKEFTGVSPVEFKKQSAGAGDDNTIT